MSRRVGDAAFSRVEKLNSELFSLTYGAIVTQLLKDYEETDATNAQLEKMGYNIGVRLIDEFLAKAQVGQCGSFQETAEVIAKVGFKMFLGITAEVVGASASEFSLQLTENPLAEFVELPEHYSSLAYSNMLCGVLRGALEMVQVRHHGRHHGWHHGRHHGRLADTHTRTRTQRVSEARARARRHTGSNARLASLPHRWRCAHSLPYALHPSHCSLLGACFLRPLADAGGVHAHQGHIVG